MSKEIQELKFKLKDVEDKNKKFKANIEEDENNFNIYAKMLVDSNNKALEKFKYFYKKNKR